MNELVKKLEASIIQLRFEEVFYEPDAKESKDDEKVEDEFYTIGDLKAWRFNLMFS